LLNQPTIRRKGAELRIGYCTAATGKQLRSTCLYHCRQCSIVLKPRSDRIDRLRRRLLYDARLQPNIAKNTVPV